MNLPVKVFGLRCSNGWINHKHRSYRPPCWPPPKDWVVTEDRNGKILSYWGDPVWDVTPWAGVSMCLDFNLRKGKTTTHIDQENTELLRILTTWRIWGIRGGTAASTIKGIFIAVKRVISICSKNGILASDLYRYPRVIDEIANNLPKSEFRKTILEFHRLWDAREYIGFYVIDPKGLERWAIVAPHCEVVQTAYIPPRIWAYQIGRLKQCIDDFVFHSNNIEECFKFCIKAYAQNHGSLEKSLIRLSRHRLPFWTPKHPGKGSQSGCIFHGPFHLTAERFNIANVIEKWIGKSANSLQIRNFSAYLSLVQYTCLAYIANFTLQRINEVGNLRTDCLIWEDDEVLGRIPIICGETTKTDQDSDARWPTSPSIKNAVDAIALIAKLRMISSQKHPAVYPSSVDVKNPYIFGASNDPWSGNLPSPYHIRPHVGHYKAVLKRFKYLFDEEEMRITEEDFRIATMLTPSIYDKGEYAVGKVWPIAWHQIRRTVAVNMFASNLLSDSTMQFQMKHSSRLMPLYYGRGYTKLRLNDEVESLIINAMYEVMAYKLQDATSDRYVSPLGIQRKEAILINLVTDKDISQLSRAGREGRIYFRETRIGACTHRGVCTYGGIESISRCTGGDGDSPCADALYDKNKEQGIENEITLINHELNGINSESPRYRALLIERQGMENYLNVIRKAK